MFGNFIQSALKNPYINSAVGKTGKAITAVGTALKAPQLTNGGFGAQLQSAAGYFAPKKAYASQGEFSTPTTSVKGTSTNFNVLDYNRAYDAARAGRTGSTYNNNVSTGSVAPSTSGEGVSGGADSSGDSGSGYDYLGALRDSFNKSRGALEGMLPTYDTDYANYEKNINSQIDTARQTKAQQDAADEVTYGKSLRNLLRSDNDLRQRRQGVFSSLNALDSSAFRDDVTKGDQALLENQQALEAEKRNFQQDRQKEFTAYENQAKTQLSSYLTEIQRAKQSLQQAIANVDLDEASNIQNYISQLENSAAQVQTNLQAAAMNLAQLAAQGVDVTGNLRNMNMGQFANVFGQNIANKIGQVTSRYTLPQNKTAGSGYINPRTGAAYTDEERRLLGI